MGQRKWIAGLLMLSAAMLFGGCTEKDDRAQSVEMSETEKKAAKVLDFSPKDYVSLGTYKGVQVNYVTPEVSKDAIKDEISILIDENTQYNEITDRPAAKGDQVTIDYTGRINGAEFEGGSDTGYELILGSNDFLEDFEKQLEGVNAGATVTIKVTFPEDYYEDMAGKEAEFTVTVHSIKEVVVPEYNDELVKQSTDFATTGEYEEDLRGLLIQEATEESESLAGEEALAAAIENADIDGYPQELFDACRTETVASYESYAQMFGVDLDSFLKDYMDMDASDVDDATKDWVNEIIVVKAIAEKEGLAVSEEEYQKEMEAMAEEYGYESVAEMEEDSGIVSTRSSVIRQKVLDFLYKNADVTEISQEAYDNLQNGTEEAMPQEETSEELKITVD